MPTSFPVTTARELRLAGAEAAEFLATTGWTLTSDPESFRYVGDIVRNDQFVVARSWQTAGEFIFEVCPELHGGDHLQLTVGLEGDLTFFLGDHAEVMSPGKIMLSRPSAFTGSRSTGPVALMFIVIPGRSMPEGALFAAGQASPDYLPLLLTAMNSFLNQSSTPSDAGFARVERALEQLTIAVAAESDLTYVETIGDEQRALYLRALTLITAAAPDPGTDVAKLAAALGVSRTRLFDAFQITGDTPAKQLRRARLTLAQQSLANGDSEELAAQRAGFDTVRRLRAAQQSSASSAPPERETHRGGVTAASGAALTPPEQ